MRLVNVQLRYDTAISPEQFGRIREACVGTSFDPTMDEDGKIDRIWQDFILDIDTVELDLLMLVSLKGPVLKHGIENKEDYPRSSVVINKVCNVAVPGNALAAIRSVEVMEDACTEQLQYRLSQGWCILAVCPQPDSRRPDYILGHIELGKTM